MHPTRRELLGAIGGVAWSQTADRQPPHIVYILADDLGWGDPGCYNPDSAVPTPNHDRLAREGVRFTDAHSPSSVCTPTRYGILTGRYAWRTRLKSGVLQGYSRALIEPDRTTVAGLLKRRGYHTACIGKWHLGFGASEPVDYARPLRPGPLDHGFDYFYGIPASLDFEPYLYVENDRAVEQPTGSTPGLNAPRGVFWRKGKVAPSFEFEEVLPNLTRRAVDYIRGRAARGRQPFFLYLPLTGPHTPWLPLRRFEGRSRAGIYGDFVNQVDDTVGQVLAALDESGVSGNTLLIVTSDNGAHWTPQDKARYPHRANAHWRGMKADVHEAGHRVPLLARWPGRIAPGRVSTQLTCLTDFMATAAAIGGTRLEAGEGEDSFSMLPALTAGAPQSADGPAREAMVHHSADGLFALRSREWKLIVGRGSGGFSEPRRITPPPGEPAGELYNLRVDPAEQDNRYAREPERVRELTLLLEQYQSEGRSRPL